MHNLQVEVRRNDTTFWPNFPREVRPLSQCPRRCTARGLCTFLYTETGRRPDIQPVCECYYGWQVSRLHPARISCKQARSRSLAARYRNVSPIASSLSDAVMML